MKKLISVLCLQGVFLPRLYCIRICLACWPQLSRMVKQESYLQVVIHTNKILSWIDRIIWGDGHEWQQMVWLLRKIVILCHFSPQQCQVLVGLFNNLEMSKSKTQKSLFHKSKSSERGSHAYPWTDKHFLDLYPSPPAITPSPTTFAVTLNYKTNALKVRLPIGIQTQHLPFIFHQEIYRFLVESRDSNPLFKTALVVGFESAHRDLLLDYRISIGQGTLEAEKLSFNCIQFVGEGRLKKYQVLKCLAIGGFSKVYLVRSLRDGQFYAMKVMLKQFICENQKENIVENEKDICAQLNHPFVVKLNHCFETHHFVCFVLQYCPGGELFYYLKSVKRMSEEQARFYFIQILYGLMYLHQQNIIYRDLKPENLLINHDGHVKIADFGLSKAGLDSREVTYSFCGSTEYMPPEMIQKSGHSYGVDFYTLGALLYELVTGLPPFYSRNEEEIKEAIINQQLTFPDHVSLSPQIKSLLNGLLNKNPKLRLGSMKGLKEVLFHPWIGRINSESVLSKKLIPPYIPTYEQFNFDENELGDDEQQFTEALLHEHLIPASMERLIYRDFQFTNENSLRDEVRAIFEKYRGGQKQKVMRNCTSAKSLQKSASKSSLKRQNSSSGLFASESKINRSKSPKSKPKRNHSVQILDVNFKKFSSTCGEFSALKKTSIAGRQQPARNKENNLSSGLKKKKIKNNFIK